MKVSHVHCRARDFQQIESGANGGVAMCRLLFLALICLAVGSGAAAQELSFPEAAVGDAAALSKAMPELAQQVMAVYKEGDRDKYLDNLFRLQMVAGNYADALSTIASLRESLRVKHEGRAEWINVQYEIYARAMARKDGEKAPFNDAFQQSFHDAFGQLDGPTSALVIRALTTIDPSDLQQTLQNDLDKQQGKGAIPLADALILVHDYQAAESYRAFAPLSPGLIAEDDRRRYLIEKDISVKTPDGATLCALLVRPRAVSGRLPALFNFTIYVNPNNDLADARLSAANGYAGVVAYTRGKACSPDKPMAYEHDGSDGAAVIDWVSTQPWNDGRVGMYGGSYEGFTQWAVAKRMPKALKAIMTGSPAAPGIDVPMEGNVFWNFLYPWALYTTNTKGNDDSVYASRNWRQVNHDWYVSGRAYRDLDKIVGTTNSIFDQWITHPGYDAYWQSLIPYEKEFARINIPVLVTAGYYYGGPGAADYYFTQHYKYDPQADDYLLIGPYDHLGAINGVVGLLGNVFNNLSGLELDPVAQIDLTELRYQWCDYIFKAGPKPSLLKDKVNYEVTGANVWKHAPTLAAMADQTLRFHLGTVRSGNTYRLSEQKPSDDTFATLKVDLADRTDVDRNGPGGGVLDSAVDPWNGIEFVSDPLPRATELSGLFAGRLDFISNKKDFDFEIDLYEQTPKGEYTQLTSYWTRASYTEDRSQRRLLTPGKRQRLDFQSVRLMSRQLQPGSRVVAVFSVIKEPGRQINYGTGKDVSDETIADAKEPLQIKWFGDSYIVLPVGR
jgi:uncharacterized protein